MGAVRQLIRGTLGALLPSSRYLLHGPRTSGAVALTFDDGPHPDITPRLLDLLQQHQLRATFFVVGREAERFPHLVQRMAREGHTVGHHSWTHSEPSTTTAATLLEEVSRCRALLEELTGAPTDWFRPPKGQLTAAKLLRLLAAGQRIVLWSSDPKDYAMTDGAELGRWAQGRRFVSGEVVLLHDVRNHCVAALPALAGRLGALHLRGVSLNEWYEA